MIKIFNQNVMKIELGIQNREVRHKKRADESTISSAPWSVRYLGGHTAPPLRYAVLNGYPMSVVGRVVRGPAA